MNIFPFSGSICKDRKHGGGPFRIFFRMMPPTKEIAKMGGGKGGAAVSPIFWLTCSVTVTSSKLWRFYTLTPNLNFNATSLPPTVHKNMISGVLTLSRLKLSGPWTHGHCASGWTGPSASRCSERSSIRQRSTGEKTSGRSPCTAVLVWIWSHFTIAFPYHLSWKSSCTNCIKESSHRGQNAPEPTRKLLLAILLTYFGWKRWMISWKKLGIWKFEARP